MEILKSIGSATEGLGWWNGGTYLLSRLIARTTGDRCRLVKYYFVAQPVPEHGQRARSEPATITVREVAADNPIVRVFPRPSGVIRARFSAGARCFTAAKANRFVGFLWIVEGRYMEDEVRCLYLLEAAERAAWDFDVYVEPEFRLTRAFARLWDAGGAFLRERRYSWSFSRISAFNPDSIAAHRRLGIRRLQTGVFLVLGKIQVSFFTCWPFVHVSLGEASYPVLRLRAPVEADADSSR